MFNWLKQIFQKSAATPVVEIDSDDPIIPVFMPALVVLLVHGEDDKGAPLTEQEVLDIRDNAVCMTMRVSMAMQMAENRGYDDISPENCWNDWQEYKDQCP